MVLQPMGPHYDLEVRRSQLPSEDMWKAASKKDKRCVDMHAILYIHVYTTSLVGYGTMESASIHASFVVYMYIYVL